MPLKTSEEIISLPHITTFVTIGVGAWLSYRHYAAAAERLHRREDIPFGELRLVQEGKDPKFQIIAVQGLGSHPKRTWKSKKGNNTDADDKKGPDLLMDLLPTHFKDARITQWVYNSDWDCDGSVASMTEFGKDLLRQLNSHFEGYEDKDNMLPVIFLGHSFGGLVIKEAFVAAKSNDDYIWKATRGIIFLGTPHMGSSMWWMATLGACFNITLGSSVELAEAVRLHHSHLKNLKDEFRDRLARGGSSNMRIVSISEAKPMYLFGLSTGLVVDRSSSEEHADERVLWSCDHTELNKFPSDNDPRFQGLLRCIKSLVPSYILENADKTIRELCYADGELKIDRISGDPLELDDCYINLGLVQVPAENDRGDEPLVSQPPQHTLMSRLRLEEPDSTRKMELSQLFDPITIDARQKDVKSREGPTLDEKEAKQIDVKRVLIYGRAGVGKSTLCKKIVYEFKKGRIWKSKFDRLLWIPLRDIKHLQGEERTLEVVLNRRFFQHHCQDNTLAQQMGKQLRLEKFERTVFLLDGLDEVADSGPDLLLEFLINRPNVVITSRPHFHLPRRMNPADIEAEVIGFTLDQVDDYIDKSKYGSPGDIRKFLHTNKLVYDLARIPIQLDALCYTWNSEVGDWGETKSPRSMTELYQAIEIRLAQKDLERGKSKHSDNALGRSELDIQDESTRSTNLLRSLAFAGMCLNEVNFDDKLRDLIRKRFGPEYDIPRSASILQDLSFLRSTSTSFQGVIDHTSYHFLHLTHQEYFAAQYFVQQWLKKKPLVVLSSHGPGSVTTQEVPIEKFLLKNKYLPGFDVFWRFVCGLLPEDQQIKFFELLGQNPDILGPTHQRLIMHCLAEAKSTLPVRCQLERELESWACLELCQWDPDSQLAAGAEFPESSILRILTKHLDIQQRFLRAVSGRYSLSSAILTEVFHGAVLAGEDYVVRKEGMSLLAKFSLPQDVMCRILEKAEDAEKEVALAAIEVLASQRALSQLSTETIERYARSSDPDVSSSMAKILEKCKYFPDVLLPYLPSWRQADDQKLRLAVIDILSHWHDHDVKPIEDSVMPRQDDDMEVRLASMNLLAAQKAPTLKMLEPAIESYDYDPEPAPRPSACDEGTLLRRGPSSHDLARVELIRHHHAILGPVYRKLLPSSPKATQRMLLRDLNHFDSLSSDVVGGLVHLLQSDNADIRRTAFRILAAEESLDQEILTMLTMNLDDLSRNTWYFPDSPSRRNLSTSFFHSLQLLPQEEEHSARGRAVQILQQESHLSNEVLEELMPGLQNPRTISHDILKLFHKLHKLEDFPEELEQSLVSLLAHQNDDIQSEAGRILGNHSSLRPASLESIMDHLKGPHEKSRLAAINAVKGLSALPDQVCDIFCSLLKQFEETRLPICKALHRGHLMTYDRLHEGLSLALARLFEDKDPVVRRKVFNLFQERYKGTVPESTIEYLICRFRQYRNGDDQSLRISIAKAMGVHISESELAPTFVSMLCKDITQVQIAFLESFFPTASVSNHSAEMMLPLFDQDYLDIEQRLDFKPLSWFRERTDIGLSLANLIWHGDNKVITPKIAVKMKQLLYDDDPKIKRAAGKVLARHDSDQDLHIFAGLLRDSVSIVSDMASDVLTDATLKSNLPADCLDVLREILGDKCTGDDLKAKVFQILKRKHFYSETRSAKALLAQVLLFLESRKFCQDAVDVLLKFDDLSGLELGHAMLKTPYSRQSAILFQLLLNRCKTEELQTSLNDPHATIWLYRAALEISWKEAISMHFMTKDMLQINTRTEVKTVKMEDPQTFLAKIEDFRNRLCQISGIPTLLGIKNVSLSGTSQARS